MRIGIVTQAEDLSAYVAEMFKTWGLVGFDFVPLQLVDTLDPGSTPVLVCPASEQGARAHRSLIGFAQRGGTLITFLPTGELADAAGLTHRGRKEPPLRLRISEHPAAGVSGEELPIVGEARSYHPQSDQVRALALLNYPGQFDGETVGVTETPLGEGRVVVFAFDLPRCVLMLRQGDPAHADRVPEATGAWSCTENLGADIGPADCAWLPFADLIARWLVDMVRRYTPAPLPMLWHLPGDASSLVLYSGDEDGADIAWVEQEFETVTAAGVRMNLYIIPIGTTSTREDVQRYMEHHDVGPHPNLQALDGRPRQERVAEFERQILLFEEMYGFRPKSVRNHCLAWTGYLDLVEVEARLGIRMDSNYLCTAFLRDRCPGPYHVNGAAMPMRFCHPNGRTIDVFQQHTHLSDDVWFHPSAPKSFRYSPQQYKVIVDRILDDSAARFHTPYGVIIHPSNWVVFSEQQGRVLLREARAKGIPIWSYDQWCDFWDLRDGWCLQDLSWANGTLTYHASGAADSNDLRWLVPAQFAGKTLESVRVDGKPIQFQPVTRYGDPVVLVPQPKGSTDCTIQVLYR
jgi:hypothetical protein